MKILFWILSVVSVWSLSFAAALYYSNIQNPAGMVMILFLPSLISGLLLAILAGFINSKVLKESWLNLIKAFSIALAALVIIVVVSGFIRFNFTDADIYVEETETLKTETLEL